MRVVRRGHWVAVVGLLFALGAVRLAGAEDTKPEDRMRKDLTYLASDELEGRGTATKGNALAAEFIVAQFTKAGLKPGGKDGSWFQPFTVRGSALEEKPTLVLTGPKGQEIALVAGKDFEALGISGSGKFENVALDFASFGLTVTDKDKAVVYDDYKDLDVKGKAVIVLRATPRDEKGELPFAPSARQKVSISTLDRKVAYAAEHGAVAILIVNNEPTAKNGDQLMPFSMAAPLREPEKLPVFQIARARVDELLKSTETGLKAREEKIEKDLQPESCELKGWKISGSVKVKKGIDARNVIGVLEGSGPLANETIVVGAHYDHLGFGGIGSLLRGARNPAIHHGADDNGSGSTMVMELARRFGAIKNREGRRLVFMTFSGEELGLFGSRHYCDNPLFPLAETAAMVNLDMVGRLSVDKDSGKEKLLIEGSGSAKTFDSLLDNWNKKYDFKLVKQASGNGPSDHDSFYRKKVPVLFFWTGTHPDYHRPTDTADRINYTGMAKIANWSEEVIQYLTTVKDKPVYVKVAGSGGRRGGMRIGIGFKDAEDGVGAVVESVTANSPADKGGLKPNDRIIALGEKPVKNPEGFITEAQNLKVDQQATLVVMRGDKKMEIKITPVRIPTFGLRPSYGDQKEGVLLAGVVDDGPAAKAGLKVGDRIVAIGGKDIKNLQGYMDSLFNFKAGDSVEVTVVRDDKKMTLKVVPE